MEIFFTDIQKITVQSNLLSFIISGLYLKWPHLSIFKTNTVFIVIGTILMTAGIGFFCFLLPFQLINNWDYLIDSERYKKYPMFINIFVNFLTHFFAQLFYLNMLKQLFYNSQKWHVFPGKLSTSINFLIAFWIWIFIQNIFFSYFDGYHPAYGIFSNLNYNTNFLTTHRIKKFNLKAFLFAFVFVWTISLLMVSYIWWFSIKINPITKSNREIKNKENIFFN